MELNYLVLKVDRSIEIGNFRIDRFADNFTLAGVKESSHFYQLTLAIAIRRQRLQGSHVFFCSGIRTQNGIWRSIVSLLESTTSCVIN